MGKLIWEWVACWVQAWLITACHHMNVTSSLQSDFIALEAKHQKANTNAALVSKCWLSRKSSLVIKCISPYSHEAFIFEIWWRESWELWLFFFLFFSPETQILRPLNRKKQCSEMTLLQLPFIDPPNGTIVQQENSKEWLQLLWLTHYKEDDSCIVSSLSDFPVSTMLKTGWYPLVHIVSTEQSIKQGSQICSLSRAHSVCKNKALLSTCQECTDAQQTHWKQSDLQSLSSWEAQYSEDKQLPYLTFRAKENKKQQQNI